MTLYVVTGAPCAGKSTWVRERAKTGDIVVDLDRIALAITAEGTPHHEYPAHVRKAAMVVRKTVVAIAVAYGRRGTSYVIHSKPSERALKQYARAGAVVVNIHAPMHVLIARAKAERPPRIVAMLATWFDEVDAEDA